MSWISFQTYFCSRIQELKYSVLLYFLSPQGYLMDTECFDLLFQPWGYFVKVFSGAASIRLIKFLGQFSKQLTVSNFSLYQWFDSLFVQSVIFPPLAVLGSPRKGMQGQLELQNKVVLYYNRKYKIFTNSSDVNTWLNK